MCIQAQPQAQKVQEQVRALLPGQPGTKKLTDQYGDVLVCVRYRYDSLHHQRMTTVEIIIDQESWHLNSARIPPNGCAN